MSPKLYDYFFHYNHYTDLWAAVPRNMTQHYLNDYNNERILKMQNLLDLIKIVSNLPYNEHEPSPH